MKHIVISTMLMLITLSINAVNYDVVPMPQTIQPESGTPFVLNHEVSIWADKGLEREATFLHDYLAELTGQQLPVTTQKQRHQRYIELIVSPKVTDKEGYVLTVTGKTITIQGGSAAGVFYGIQTLRKAVATQGGTSTVFPPVVIRDAPRFPYRGMHLDCSRHFFPIDFVKKYIDLLALHNMNTFHWHLSDDQGWRIEISK